MDRQKNASASPAAAVSPLPPVEINPTKAPGLKGPKGLSPKTNYSRVNSGLPPQPDAGADAQKGLPPMGANSLPKLAEEATMNAYKTPTLQELVKAATNTANRRVAASLASDRLSKTASETCKECGKEDCKCGEKKASVSTEHAEKFASALEYVLPLLKEANIVEPGAGPGALPVLEARAEGALPQHHGQAHAQPSMNPGLQKATKAGPATQMDNTIEHAPAAGAKMVEKNAQRLAAVLGKTAEEDKKLEKEETKGMAEAEKGLARAEAAHSKENGEKKAGLEGTLKGALIGGVPGAFAGHKQEEAGYDEPFQAGLRGVGGYLAGAVPTSILLGHALQNAPIPIAALGPAVGGVGAGYLGYRAATQKYDKPNPDKKGGSKKESADLSSLGEALRAHVKSVGEAAVKQAEDAINPAHISAGAAVPPDTSAAGEAGGTPAGGSPQGPTGLIGSNDAAIGYNKAEAIANRKQDMKKYLNEPMHSNATDSTLKDVLVHSSTKDNNKFASAHQAATKTAAARALLAKLAEEELVRKNGASA